ncbi:branched-chain amino acid ABC transporter permease [Paracandidimonas lactea]|uniref:branched-chain amino acid ABC transporter permease n=1 Tax=Paracandidimonas lactea TaxID=2895524 RepID=UPI001F43525A
MTLANAIWNGLVLGCLLSLPAIAVTLIFGVARFPNAATGDMMTVGAYTALALKLSLGASLVAGAAFATLASALLAVLFYLVVFSKLEGRSPVSNLVASIGVAFAARSTITFFLGYNQYSLDLPLMRAWNFNGFVILPTDLALVAVALICLGVAFFILHRTSIGRHMRSVADNPELARVSGISRRKVMCVLWAISGAFAGLGGVLMGAKAVVIPELGWELLMPIFAGVIVGGIGSPIGAVIGMCAFGVAMELATALFSPSYRLPLSFFVVLVLLLIRPRGLFGKISVER